MLSILPNGIILCHLEDHEGRSFARVFPPDARINGEEPLVTLRLTDALYAFLQELCVGHLEEKAASLRMQMQRLQDAMQLPTL